MSRIGIGCLTDADEAGREWTLGSDLTLWHSGPRFSLGLPRSPFTVIVP